MAFGCGTFGKQLGHEGGALVFGISACYGLNIVHPSETYVEICLALWQCLEVGAFQR